MDSWLTADWPQPLLVRKTDYNQLRRRRRRRRPRWRRLHFIEHDPFDTHQSGTGTGTRNGNQMDSIGLYLDKQLVIFNGMHSAWICKCVFHYAADIHLPKLSPQSDIVVINVCVCVCVCVVHAKQSTPQSTPLNVPLLLALIRVVYWLGFAFGESMFLSSALPPFHLLAPATETHIVLPRGTPHQQQEICHIYIANVCRRSRPARALSPSLSGHKFCNTNINNISHPIANCQRLLASGEWHRCRWLPHTWFWTPRRADSNTKGGVATLLWVFKSA